MQTGTLVFLCVNAGVSCVVWGAMNFGGAIIFLGSWQAAKLLGLSLPGFGPREANFCAAVLDIMALSILMATTIVFNLPKCAKWRYVLVLLIPSLIGTPIGVEVLMHLSRGKEEEREFAEGLGVIFLAFSLAQLTLEALRREAKGEQPPTGRPAGHHLDQEGASGHEYAPLCSGNSSEMQKERAQPDNALKLIIPASGCREDGGNCAGSPSSAVNQSDWFRVEMWVIHHEFSNDWIFLFASIAAAFALGFCGACFGMGGPPILILFNLAQCNPTEQRLTFVPSAFVGCSLRIVLLLTARDSEMVSLFLAEWRLVPALVVFGLLGGSIGWYSSSHMDKNLFMKILLWVLVLAGLEMTGSLDAKTYAEAGLLSSNTGSASMFLFLLWAELYACYAVAGCLWRRRREQGAAATEGSPKARGITPFNAGDRHD
mmetsp:Transcript_68258/g.142224  ORF Transcript_68258/g.142224 Transcript_68258/m.142224 type:complete len:429 (+) Transcript_68258:137-1423(+)|eukprot:CAMPEP_0181328206 /NCGR_PEP_ID=MMETSP1101-20121128/22565_1 /TAXON_ID=46948 /ORGANISM="Rhodomonas abbreviata, Strain Caron Lab Isolate" /LENGTH=428 /DNA_ID=CAMNT_0023437025 /DNA_START=137 /DNA_END=1423 /DNA_ORIENTATION=+